MMHIYFITHIDKALYNLKEIIRPELCYRCILPRPQSLSPLQMQNADADGEKVMRVKVNMHTDAPTIKALHNIRCIFHHSS